MTAMTTPATSRRLSRLLSGAGFALAMALAGPAAAEGESLADAQRIVAIGGSVTEIVYALGEEGRLVARDTTSGYPEAATELPDVGYMRALAPEGVLSVRPDAILTLEGSGPPETLTVLKAAGVPYVTVPEGYDEKGILDKIEVIGTSLGVEAKAGELADRVRAELEAATAEAEARGRNARVLFILSMNGGRILASGSGTAADGILAMAGAQNAFADFAGYKQLNDEAVISAAPDAILMISRGEGHAAPVDDVLSHPAIAQTPAGANKRLIRMDGLYLLGFGPRTGAAVRDLSAALAEHGL
ncbi:heme/hemin ABC transporter substrate-binding protein [Stappia sp.]|uniref:heme/hemin ABC transporter substrate-binding protein n=1 Tax=Stappia sp. TaxID=1870903 RepID=UPI003D0E4CCA